MDNENDFDLKAHIEKQKIRERRNKIFRTIAIAAAIVSAFFKLYDYGAKNIKKNPTESVFENYKNDFAVVNEALDSNGIYYTGFNENEFYIKSRGNSEISLSESEMESLQNLYFLKKSDSTLPISVTQITVEDKYTLYRLLNSTTGILYTEIDITSVTDELKCNYKSCDENWYIVYK